jgi:putative DNA methylase
LLLKCTLEYPSKYHNIGKGQSLETSEYEDPLVALYRKWSDWVFQEAKKEIGHLYPSDRDGSHPVGYIWARTIPCQNPTCNNDIPLIRQFWLARTNNRNVIFFPSVGKRKIVFEIRGDGFEKIPKTFDPDVGTVSRAIATCLVCGATIDNKTTARLFREGKSGERMIAVILENEGRTGKKYRRAEDSDMKTFADAQAPLKSTRERLMQEWGIDPIPDEPVPPKESHRAVGSQLPLYNFTAFGDLFNTRQKIAMVVFASKVREAYDRILKETSDEDLSKAVATYLALTLDRLADKNSNLVIWNVVGQKIEHTFGRQALGMTWDYVELNPFTDVGWPNMKDWIIEAINFCAYSVALNPHPINVQQVSATKIPYEDNYFDAVLTDPPYYDNVPYSYLSDFFYVWLKRSIGNLYPEFFSTNLTPKSQEIVVYANREGGLDASKRFFEDMLRASFMEIKRVLKPNGISIIVYAHKSTAGWETLVNSLLDSGLVVTSAWPIHTERQGRLTARETASLASSIYMVSRKLQRSQTGFYKEIRDSLSKHLKNVLDRLWTEGISGADFFISAIGSSIEIFGKYERIIDDEGNVVRGERLLEDVRRIVTDYAVKQVLHNGFGAEITPLTRFYVLWRWAYGTARLEFDDAWKLAQGVGIDLPKEWNKGFIKKEKEFMEVLGPEQRHSRELEGSKELIDVLHHVLLLWKQAKNEDMIRILKESGFGKSDVFYRVAQAISESLPNDSKEKKLLDGFLAGRQRIAENVRKESGQTRLFEEQ